MLYRKNSSPKLKKGRSSKVRILPPSYHQVLKCVQNGRREEESEGGSMGGPFPFQRKRRRREREKK
jgi:hypothetical protein